MALGPGIPEPLQAKVPAKSHRHKLPTGSPCIKAVLGGLHHEYSLGKGGRIATDGIFADNSGSIHELRTAAPA
jgi:hypothetical protein